MEGRGGSTTDLWHPLSTWLQLLTSVNCLLCLNWFFSKFFLFLPFFLTCLDWTCYKEVSSVILPCLSDVWWQTPSVHCLNHLHHTTVSSTLKHCQLSPLMGSQYFIIYNIPEYYFRIVQHLDTSNLFYIYFVDSVQLISLYVSNGRNLSLMKNLIETVIGVCM